MVYDSSKGLMIVFGGTYIPHDFNDTWAYDPAANSWTELKPSGTLPEGRNGLSMAYDLSSDRVVMFGGFSGGTSGVRGLLGDTWEYDAVANTWTELRLTGETPAARQYGSLIYCPSTSQAVLFGGHNGKASLNDTWAFSP